MLPSNSIASSATSSDREATACGDGDLFCRHARLQRAMREGRSPLFAFVYQCSSRRLENGCGGWGDRLSGLVLSYYMAVLSQRAFFILMDEGIAPVAFDEILTPADDGPDWRVDNLSAQMQDRLRHPERFIYGRKTSDLWQISCSTDVPVLGGVVSGYMSFVHDLGIAKRFPQFVRTLPKESYSLNDPGMYFADFKSFGYVKVSRSPLGRTGDMRPYQDGRAIGHGHTTANNAGDSFRYFWTQTQTRLRGTIISEIF